MEGHKWHSYLVDSSARQSVPKENGVGIRQSGDVAGGVAGIHRHAFRCKRRYHIESHQQFRLMGTYNKTTHLQDGKKLADVLPADTYHFVWIVHLRYLNYSSDR